MGGSLQIQTLVDRIKGPIDALRLKMQLRRVRAPAPDGAASAADIDALVDHQLGHWRRRGIDRTKLMAGCRTLNEKSISVFVFEIRAGTVKVWDKPGFSFPHELRALRGMEARSFANRKALYRVLLQTALTRSGIDADMTLAMDVNDIPIRLRGGPLFAFQTADASRNILLPDVDFFHWNWYAGQHDDRGYDDKAIRACFAGASTGGHISETTIAERALPRLRAAAHFLDSPVVDFRIAKAVLCETEAARALLQRQPYFRAPMTWREQFGHRFLVSMDGNGATCSRVVIALKSNSALIKYRSNFGLYYFPEMVAGRDYIDAASDQDVTDTVNAEIASPGHFKAVAAAGQAFAARYLNKASVLDYTGALLRGYARIYNG